MRRERFVPAYKARRRSRERGLEPQAIVGQIKAEMAFDDEPFPTRAAASAFVIALNPLPDGSVGVATTRAGRFDAAYTPVEPGEPLGRLVSRAVAEVDWLSPARRDPS
jgi:hypothetical protein